MEVRKESHRIRRMFADISPRYDLLNHVLSLNVDRSWRRKAARELDIRSSDMALDVCTGTADLALELARHVSRSSGGFVVGTDFCPEMVALGERKRRRLGEEGLSLLSGDTLELPFADATFDVVAVAFGIRNVFDLRRGIEEMRRVLRPGGRMAILEFTTPRSRWLSALFALYFHRVLPLVGRWLSRRPRGAEAYSYLPASVEDFPSPSEIVRLLEDAGFTEVRYRLLTGGIACLHLGRRPDSAALRGDPVETGGASSGTRREGLPARETDASDLASTLREETVPWKKP